MRVHRHRVPNDPAMAPRSRFGRLGPYQAARTATDLVVAPYTLYRKLRKVIRNPHAHANEFASARWNCRRNGGADESDRPDRPGGPHVVLVGKGFGELRLVELLDTELRLRRPDVRTTWCGQVREFFDAVARSNPRQPTTSTPFDFAAAVTRWLANVRPDVVVFVENFWRPMLVLGCHAAGVRVVAVNAVFREGKTPATSLGPLDRVEARRILRAVSAVHFQSDEQARFAAASVPTGTNTAVTGNLKMNLRPARVDPVRMTELGRWLHRTDDRPLFAAGSTRRGDESFALEAFARVRRDMPCALLLAPRQMERIGEVERTVVEAGFTVSLRSRPTAGADVFLLDTIGELTAAYAFAAAAFLGGTLRHRGQNFVEPLLLGLPVSFGHAHVYLAAEQRACAAAGLATQVTSSDQLAEHWKLVRKESSREEFKARATNFLDTHRGALLRSVEMIVEQSVASDRTRRPRRG